MTSAKTGSIGGRQPSVVRNADILMYDEGLFCGTEKGSIAVIVPTRAGRLKPFLELGLRHRNPTISCRKRIEDRDVYGRLTPRRPLRTRSHRATRPGTKPLRIG